MDQNHSHVSAAGEGIVAGLGLSSPKWVQMVEGGVHWVLLIGAVLLLALRLLNAWGEYRARRGQRRRWTDHGL